MQKKLMSWKTKGMNQDVSVSAFSPEFSFENRNLRLATNEGNTFMSWVNERGTKQIGTITVDGVEEIIQGTPIGTAVINEYLVIFTTKPQITPSDVGYKPDYIYRFEYDESVDTMIGTLLYHGNLGFNINYPIDTLVSYESQEIMKVYWTDNHCQPRLINIAHEAHEDDDTQFDFVPAVSLPSEDSVILERNLSGGIFPPGVIQYAFTYFNKYGQQSNIVWVSPLYYLSYADRGANPEERTSCSFTLTIKKPDEHFNCIRVYSIQRTSLDATPIARIVQDLEIKNAEDVDDGNTSYKQLTLTDNGTIGSSLDPTELLFVGGKEIKVLTMMDKDQTLFLGNIKQETVYTEDIQEYIDSIRDNLNITFSADKVLELPPADGLYPYKNSLWKNQQEITTFKGGETYRLGFQVQKATGEWSDPIWLDDVENTVYPSINNNRQLLSYASWEFEIPSGDDVPKFSDFKKIRPVIVYPTIADRTVLCQGVLNPTVFNTLDRETNSPFTQSSWFFRPYTPKLFNGDNVGDYVRVDEVLPSESFPTVPTNARVLIATVSPNDLSKVKQSENINTYGGHTHQKYDGIINLSSLGIPWVNKYAFVRTFDDWLTPGNDPNQESSAEYFSYIQNPEICPASSELAAGITSRPPEEPFYYYAGTDASVSFYFEYNNTWYKVTFNNTGASSSINKKDLEGNPIAFTHYDSLPTSGDSVEIQGALNAYSTPWSGRNKDMTANTQFMIDQSIVTLHSPDIEFDTEVQDFPMENLGLRIIGAVPITSYASAHEISVGPMLQKDITIDTNNKMKYPETSVFGAGDLSMDVSHPNKSVFAGSRFVRRDLWEDVIVTPEGGELAKTGDSLTRYSVYPWQRSGSLNNDTRPSAYASSLLKTKKISHLLFSYNTEYLSEFVDYNSLSAQIYLTENSFVQNIRLPKQDSAAEDINYYPNIDKILYSNTDSSGNNTPISMKYKSTSHAILSLNYEEVDGRERIQLMPYGDYGSETVGKYDGSGIPYWRKDGIYFGQPSINISNLFGGVHQSYLWLGELYRKEDNLVKFGGNSKEALKANTWLVAGDTKTIPQEGSSVTLEWTVGDTYYQRYDCLKTYPFTADDNNQNTEILSFMCETHVNIDGRYDRNRGQVKNYTMTPQNFNLLNPIYSQKDNFFIGKIVDRDNNKSSEFPNQVTFTLTKTSGADIDEWTHITLASNLELDGDKGSVKSIRRLNDQLVCFQDKGISQILYNERVQISTEQGVPIELANSGKVQGKKYLSDTIGCSNKWSIVNTPSGIYFMDSNEKSIYRLGEGLQNISQQGGFNAWCKRNIPDASIEWTPSNIHHFRAFYDKLNQDVLFVNDSTAIAFSEKIGAFTSFYDYGNTPYFDYLGSNGIWLRKDGSLWRHQQGNYCNFFGTENSPNYRPYSITLVGNQDLQMNKIFTNLEFRASVTGEGTEVSGKYTPLIPFDSLEVWDEYQHGKTLLHTACKPEPHFQKTSNALMRKFRIWRCDIPRDNMDVNAAMENPKGIYRMNKHPLDRMRNPWLYLKLEKQSDGNKTELHDFVMTYFL